MKKFDNELAELQDRIVDMATLAKSMVDLVCRAVKDRTLQFRGKLDESEARLDRMQIEADGNAVRLLTVYGPVATDLRYVLVATHVTAQLERIGDQVINVCEALELMQTAPEHGTLPDLQQMADSVREIVEQAMSAFFGKDAELAERTRAQDDLIDAQNAQIVKKLLSDEVLRDVLQGTADIADALAQILLSRHLERIADQAVNICKEVVYMVKGDDVRHRSRMKDADA